MIFQVKRDTYWDCFSCIPESLWLRAKSSSAQVGDHFAFGNKLVQQFVSKLRRNKVHVAHVSVSVVCGWSPLCDSSGRENVLCVRMPSERLQYTKMMITITTHNMLIAFNISCGTLSLHVDLIATQFILIWNYLRQRISFTVVVCVCVCGAEIMRSEGANEMKSFFVFIFPIQFVSGRLSGSGELSSLSRTIVRIQFGILCQMKIKFNNFRGKSSEDMDAGCGLRACT